MPKSYHRHDDAVPDIRVDVALRDAILVRSYCRLNHLGVVRCLRVGFDTETFNEACGRSAGVKRPRGSHWFDIEVGDRSRVGTFRSGRQGAAAVSASLASCSIPIADLPAIGVPADAPARPKDPGSFPAVHDMPPDRSEPALARDDQARIETELEAARDRQARAAAAANAADAPKSSARPNNGNR